MTFALLCPVHRRVHIRERDVLRQFDRPGFAWHCPLCDRPAQWCLDNAPMFGMRPAA